MEVCALDPNAGAAVGRGKAAKQASRNLIDGDKAITSQPTSDLRGRA